MHPIERLRYVARATGYPQGAIVAEAARALASFTSDPQGLVTADDARSTTLKRRVDDAAGARPFRRACTRAAGAARAPTLKQI